MHEDVFWWSHLRKPEEHLHLAAFVIVYTLRSWIGESETVTFRICIQILVLDFRHIVLERVHHVAVVRRLLFVRVPTLSASKNQIDMRFDRILFIFWSTTARRLLIGHKFCAEKCDIVCICRRMHCCCAQTARPC